MKIFLEGTRFFSRRNENISRTNENISRTNDKSSRRSEKNVEGTRKKISKERTKISKERVADVGEAKIGRLSRNNRLTLCQNLAVFLVGRSFFLFFFFSEDAKL